jgi:5-methyltetrahydrofolate--homocysteine methyltransferase
MSIDSSNLEILQAGLEACDKSRGRPMVNSVSLERTQAIDVAAKHKAVIIASAAGESGLPNNTEERLANLDRLMPRLAKAGFTPGDIHVDPLVFPISVDGNNGKGFLDAVSAIRQKYGEDIHIVAGLSNVSFGMPARKIINQVFTWLAVEAGADGGIVDPLQINVKSLNSLDPKSEPFELARALLMGEDEFGMNFISASRDEKL